MIRCGFVVALCTLLLAGCVDQRRPEKRTSKVSSSDGPHGVPPAAHAMDSGSTPRNEPLASAASLGPEVQLGPLLLTAPEGWARKQPQSSFTLAEFSLPRAEGDPADGRLTVSVAGGGVEANLQRWREQFKAAADDPPPKEVEIAGMQVTLVDFSGTYQGQHGAFAPPEDIESQRMLGAIIPLGEQLGFVKASGAKQTIAKHADAFEAFVHSLRSATAKAEPSQPQQDTQPEATESKEPVP